MISALAFVKIDDIRKRVDILSDEKPQEFVYFTFVRLV